jgi:hypothetical protein
MNFPLLKTFDVSSSITSFLEKIFNRVGWDNNAGKNCFDKSRGYQTSNLLKWDNEEFKNFTENELLDLISSHLEMDKSKI